MNKPKLIYIVAASSTMLSFIIPRIEWLKKEYDLVCICSPGEEHEEARKVGLRTVKLPIARHISLWKDLTSLWYIWRILRKERPTIVHSMTPKAGLLGMAAAFIAGVPVRIHTFTGLIFPWKKGVIHHILRIADIFTCFFSNVINPEGEGVRKQLQTAHVTNKPMHIIAHGNINGVDLDRYIPQRQRAEKRTKLGIEPNETVFIFIGRLVADKGIAELVDNFCKLQQVRPTTRLILVGREEEELDPLPKLTRTIMSTHPKIICAGAQGNVETWLAASDIHVHPSHREGFCNTLLEAGAMGLPSITYDICGCHDSVNKETGILIPPYEHEILYEGMLRLVDEKATRFTLGSAARQRIETYFNRQYVWEELKLFYRKLVLSPP